MVMVMCIFCDSWKLIFSEVYNKRTEKSELDGEREFVNCEYLWDEKNRCLHVSASQKHSLIYAVKNAPFLVMLVVIKIARKIRDSKNEGHVKDKKKCLVLSMVFYNKTRDYVYLEFVLASLCNKIQKCKYNFFWGFDLSEICVFFFSL